MTDSTANALADLDEVFAGFTDEDLDSIAEWARNTGVALSELPLAMRRPTERYRELIGEHDDLADLAGAGGMSEPAAARLEELEAALGDTAGSLETAAGQAQDNGPNVRRLTATELIAVIENDTTTFVDAGIVEVPAAAEELTKRADADKVDGALEAGQPWSSEDLDEASRYVRALEDRAGGDQADEPARRFRAEAGARSREVEQIGRVLATYHDRRRRLAALEVKATRDAQAAKLELELGEAREALDAIEAILEQGA